MGPLTCRVLVTEATTIYSVSKITNVCVFLVPWTLPFLFPSVLMYPLHTANTKF